MVRTPSKNIVFSLLSLFLFAVGAVLAVWSAEKLVTGLVGLANALRLSAFVVGVVLSGLEAENVAVGLAAGSSGASSVALGSSFGGAIFLICVALGLGAAFYPMKVRLPKSFLLVFFLATVVSGIPVAFATTPRWTGALLLAIFAASMIFLVRASRKASFLAVSPEVEEIEAQNPPVWKAVGLTALGIILITVAGELVAQGAIGIIGSFGVSAALMGSVVTPAAVEAEEVARQAVPSRRGRHDVAAANMIGTVLYFALFNLGLIALITPVSVPNSVLSFDWPFLVTSAAVATAMLWRGRISRAGGILLVGLFGVFVIVHLVVL